MTEPTITAFYGFKGGTGRSFLLATCATALAALGRRVLVMDWDLEAPGVGDLFDASGNDVWMDWRRHPGILDLLLDRQFPPYTKAGESDESTTRRLHALLFEDAERRREDRYLVDVVPSRDDRRGRLSLIGPGQHRSATQYFDRLLDIDWTWYFENNGSEFLATLRRVLKRQPHFDHVLIDGRTGYSPSSISAIRYIADHVCVVGTYSFQSIDGIARVWPLLQAAESGSELTCRLVLARKPKVTDPRQIADFEGKQQLLEEYGIPGANRLELPIVSNLHGGDGHLWSRYELFARAAPRGQSASHAETGTTRDIPAQETESLFEYARGLAKLLQEVIGIESVRDPSSLEESAGDAPLLWVPGWWKAVSDNRFWSKEYSLTTVPWAQQIEYVESSVQAIGLYLKNPNDQAQRPPSVDPSNQNRENPGAGDFEPWSAPGDQSHKSLPARALLAVRANRTLNDAARPIEISEKTWHDRVGSIRLHYGVDVSPTSADPTSLIPGDDGTEPTLVEARPEVTPAASLPSELIAQWESISVSVYWGQSEWYPEDVRQQLARMLQRASDEGETLHTRALKEVMDLHQLAASVLKSSRLLNQSASPLTDVAFLALSERILQRCWRSLESAPLSGLSLAEGIFLHRRVLSCIQEVAKGKENDKAVWVTSALAALSRVLPARGGQQTTEAKIRDWSERILKAETRFLLPTSQQRSAAVSEIELVTKEAADFLTDVDVDSADASAVASVSELWALLAVLCRRYKMTVLVLPVLLSTIRLTRGTVLSLVENLELCLDELHSLGAYRASEEYTKRMRAESSDATQERASVTQWRVRAALGREWWKFSYGLSVADGDHGERYGSYREALNGLDAWLEQAQRESGAMIAEVQKSVEIFRESYRLELGLAATRSVYNDEDPIYRRVQWSRLLIAQGEPRAAEEELSNARPQEPSGLHARDPDALWFATSRLLSVLARVVDGRTGDSKFQYESARAAIALIRAHLAERAFPFDSGFEAHLPSGESRRAATADSLGLSSGTERPTPLRDELAKCLIEYAEICLRCGQRGPANQAVSEALSLLDIGDSGNVPARGFTRPLSIRMALSCALALALKAKLARRTEQERRAIDSALAWARWDCSPHNHGAGRKLYYSRVLLWCARSPQRRKEITSWLREESDGAS